MDVQGEKLLVWGLLGAAKRVLPRESRVWMCVTIGAGDRVHAINDLLEVLARHRIAVPDDLVEPLWAWASGYVGSDSESRLRDLLTRVGVSPSAVPVGTSVDATSEDGSGDQLRRPVLHAPTHGPLIARRASPETVSRGGPFVERQTAGVIANTIGVTVMATHAGLPPTAPSRSFES